MKKIISFCLWGNNPKYCIGAIKNSELSKKIYPDWIARYYVHNKVNLETINKLKNNSSEVIIIEDSIEAWSNMFWRFSPLLDPDVEAFICRDTDSRLNERERDAVYEWISSDKNTHIMRDHPYHGYPMLGGMIGFKKPIFELLKTCLSKFNPQNCYGTDYEFFHDVLYPNIANDSLVHDEFFQKHPFPTIRKNYEFVGQVFDENENTVEEHTQAIKNFYENSYTKH